MHRFRIKALIILFIFVIASQAGFPVSAKQPATVKECIENPEKCEERTSPSGGGTDGAVVQGKAPFSVWDFFKMIFATIFVIALMYILLKFMNQRNRMFASKRGLIENLGGIGVGANRSVQLIKVGNRILVIGVGESIQLLKEIEDEGEIRDILNEHNEKLTDAIEPNKWIQKLVNLGTNKKVDTQQQESFHRLFAEHLKEIREKQSNILKKLGSKGAKSDE